jgi:hypothetical protein
MSRYLRVSIAPWTIDLSSAEGARIFQQVAMDGLAVFRAQPGFVRYRLVCADDTATVAGAERESEQLSQAGADQYRAGTRRGGSWIGSLLKRAAHLPNSCLTC